jgi:hypothetical protein
LVVGGLGVELSDWDASGEELKFGETGVTVVSALSAREGEYAQSRKFCDGNFLRVGGGFRCVLAVTPMSLRCKNSADS